MSSGSGSSGPGSTEPSLKASAARRATSTLVIHSLRKYARLALKGNPTVLMLLFVKPEELLLRVPLGDELQALAPAFVSRVAGRAFLGYLSAQKQRLLGERGRKRVKRPELEDAHGFDTKYAMHMLRLGYQGSELLESGRISLPMREEERRRVFAIRKGDVEFNDVLTEIGELEQRLEDLLDTSPLPPAPTNESTRSSVRPTAAPGPPSAASRSGHRDLDLHPLKGRNGVRFPSSAGARRGASRESRRQCGRAAVVRRSRRG